MAYTALFVFTALALVVSAFAQVGSFQDPGKQHRPKFRYWLPDASVPSDIVAKDVSTMAAVGAGGLEFIPFFLYGLPVDTPQRPSDWSKYGFGTPAYTALFKDALRAAKQDDMLMDFAVGANQGQGVPVEPMTEGLAVHLLIGNASASGGTTFSGPPPPPQALPAFVLSGAGFMHPLEQFGTPNLTAVIALKVISYNQTMVSIPDNGEIPVSSVLFDETSYVDLTDQVASGTLNWTVPAGASEWRIFSFWQHYTNQRSCAGGINATTAVANGSWTVDHFSKAGAMLTTDFLDENIISDTEIAGLLKEVGNYAWEDSMEIMAAIYWTPDLLSRFKDMFDYDLVKYLPVLATASNTWGSSFPSYSEVFIYGDYTPEGDSVHSLDYRAALNAGYQDYLSHFVAWSHSRGFNYSAQPAYNLPLQMLSDIPLLDAPECESLGFRDVVDAYRQFAGPAHLAGRNTISTELGAVEAPAYSQTISDLLFRAKRSLAGGLNMVVIHGYPYSGPYPATTWPGYTTFFYRDTEMWNPLQPCWEHMKDVLGYLSRNMFVLHQGVPKVDLAFYLFAAPWLPVAQYGSTNLQDLGFTYDYLGPDDLSSLPSASYQGSGLVADGPAYKALIFDGQSIITPEAAEAVANLAVSGMPVVVIGSAPNMTYPDTASSRQRVGLAMQKLLSQKTTTAISSADDLPSALAAAAISPRLSLHCTSNPVYPVWRWDEAQATHYVFLYNDQLAAVDCKASLAVSGTYIPYVYNAWTGDEERVLAYNTTDASHIDMAFHLAANQTMIVALKAENQSQPHGCAAVASASSTVRSLKCLDDAAGKIVVALSGPGSLTAADGREHIFNISVPGPTNLPVWNISIEDWHAPETPFLVETNITYHNYSESGLVPWSRLGAGLEAVAGVGRYATQFTAPRQWCNQTYRLGGLLSIGPVAHTARVFLDGVMMPPIDLADPVLDISSYITPGRSYDLVIEMTTTLFNRIKATANETMIWGTSAALVQPLYASLPADENGLIGPVSIQWTAVVEFEF